MAHVDLVTGQHIKISMTEVEGDSNVFSVTYDKLIEDVEEGSIILLDDGLIQLEVIGKIRRRTYSYNCCKFRVLKNNKGVNVPGVSVQLPGMTEKDAEDILFGIKEGVDFIAASFVRRATDVLEIRELLETKWRKHLKSSLKLKTKKA